MKVKKLNSKVRAAILGCMSIAAVLVLVACGSNKPNDVSKEFWDKSIQSIIYMDKMTESGEFIDAQVIALSNEELYELNESEFKIYEDILNLGKASLSLALVETEDNKSQYDEQYAKLEGIFGKSNLKSSKLDEKALEKRLVEKTEKEQVETEKRRQDFLEDKNITLTGKEVQYDMVNNLNKEFYLEGSVELCDYYNYGYTNEGAFFCGKFTPTNGSYSEQWHLYFNREVFENTYNILQDSGVAKFQIIAVIPERSYTKRQGNMAIVQRARLF